MYAVNTTVWHFQESVKHLNEVCKTDNPKAIQRAIQSVNSYLGILIHYNEYATRRRILSMIKEKEIAKLLGQGKVVVIGEEKGALLVNIEDRDSG